MKFASRLGWEITSVGDIGIHLRKRKTYSRNYLLFGAVTAIFLVGLLVWIVGLLDYLARSDRHLFVPHQDLEGDAALKTADLLL